MKKKYLLFFVFYTTVMNLNAQYRNEQYESNKENWDHYKYRGDTLNFYTFPFFLREFPNLGKHTDGTRTNGFLNLKYVEYYEERDSITNDLSNFETIRYISMFLNYTDTFHKYKDKDGVMQYLPVTRIIRRWDRVGTDKWIFIDYLDNKFLEIKEYKEEIIKTDTNNTYDPTKDMWSKNVIKYYKTEVLKK